MNRCAALHQVVLALIVAGTAVLAGWSRLPAQVTQAAILPPRTAPQPETGSDSAWEECVASLELRVRFLREEEARRWQVLYTVVEWQDALGDWHEVAGWRGTLDEFLNGEGRKVWWAGRKDLGTGPFRWTVYSDPAGRLLTRSKAFFMPDVAGQTVVMEVTIRP